MTSRAAAPSSHGPETRRAECTSGTLPDMATDNRRAPAEAAPDVYRALLRFGEVVDRHAVASGLPAALSELIKIRVSQVNGCAFCLRMHTRDALARGESPDRLAVLPVWRESGYFSDQERSALALAERVTHLGESQPAGDGSPASSAPLPDVQAAAVGWLAVAMNALNRLAISSRYPVLAGPRGPAG